MITLESKRLVQAEAEQVLRPRIVRYLGIGIVGPDFVQQQKYKNHGVGNTREREGTETECQQNGKCHHEHVFQRPVGTIVRFDCQENPPNGEQQA